MGKFEGKEFKDEGRWYVGRCHHCTEYTEKDQQIYAESENDFCVRKGRPYHKRCALFFGHFMIMKLRYWL